VETLEQLGPGPLEPEDLDHTEGARTVPPTVCAHREFYQATDDLRCKACDQTFHEVQTAEVAATLRAQHPPQAVLRLPTTRHAPTSAELVESAGTNVPALVSAMHTMALRFGDFVNNMDAVNRALGEFKHDLVRPMLEEFKSLKYTLSDSAGSSVSQLHAIVGQLDKRLTLILATLGKTPQEIEHLKAEAGIADIPSLAELEREGAPAVAVEALRATSAELQKQNARLLAELNVTRKQRDRARALVKKKRTRGKR
jgi:hypothetical protein